MADQPVLPDLRLPALGRVDVAPFDLGEQRARFWSLARPAVAVVASPWLAWKLTDFGWLGPVDAGFLLLAGEIVGLIGVAWGLVAWRHELQRERWRARRVALDDRLFEQGYTTLFESYVGVSDPADGPVLLNFNGLQQQVTAMSARFDELIGAIVAQFDGSAGLPAVTICSTAGAVPVDGPSVLDLLDWGNLPALPSPVAAYDSLVEKFVDQVVQGQGYGPKSFDGICSEDEYRALVHRLVAVGVLVRVDGRSRLSDKLAGWRASWAAAGSDLAQQFTILDMAHSWVARALDVVSSVPDRV